jgi:hypothetical protein
MSDHEEERRLKARHDFTQFYQRRGVKRTTSRQDLPRGDMTISGDPNPSANISSKDDHVEDDSYIPSPLAHPHEKGLASASGSGAARDEEEIEEEEDGGNGNDGAKGVDDEEDEEVFDVEEINPTSYIHMGTLDFWLPLNPDWREKISYNGKTDLLREKRKENPRLVEKEPGVDYRFHTAFQWDFYESVIITKTKPMAISQWIDWTYMEGKNDAIFNEVVGASRAKHLRYVMAFQKNWNNEIIGQFFATLYVEERGDTRKFHWMTEGKRYEIIFGFGWNDANCIKIHFASCLNASRMRFMYPGNKRGIVGTTLDLLPFYAYLNRLFRRTVTPREGDSSNIPSYNHNLLVAMAPCPHGYEFSVFDFIWGEMKAISESLLKSCGYAPYILHMIERVTGQTFGYDMEHHPLRIKNDLRAPVELRGATAPRSSPPRATRGRGQQGDKPLSPIQKIFSLLFGMCKYQSATDVRAQHERHERRKITKSVKEIRTHLNL